MNFYEPKGHFTEVRFELTKLFNGAYPAFVTAVRPRGAPEKIPCFSFHDVAPEKFEAQLLFLKRNGYETVTLGEYLERKGEARGERLVLLTFDDGRDSLWKVAYPLLKKNGMKAVAFALPGEIRAMEGTGRTFGGGGGGLDSENELCFWPELEAMGDVVDVQSHSLSHFVMFVSEQVTCFFTPAIRKRWMRIDLPIVNGGGVERDYSLGAPFYDMDLRLSDRPRVFEPPHIRERLGEIVEKGGGDEFFEKPGWRRALMKAHDEAAAGAKFAVETEEEAEAAVFHALSESKRILEERMAKPVTGLCLPFGAGGRTAMRMAARAGYETIFWGVAAPEWTKDFPDLAHVTRIKDDYLLRLPGEGRAPLSGVFTEKIRRRLRFTISGKGRLR
ncbi:MAG: polysaccharide deacetylase family protein [Candidatus Nitrospinota bacterium M3_3B_026]